MDVAILAALIGVVTGLFGSLKFDTLCGPCIVVVALLLFILSLLSAGRRLAGRRDAKHIAIDKGGLK